MPDLPTYGDCDCGAPMVLDLDTVEGEGYVKFQCQDGDCDWAKMMARPMFEARVEASDSVTMADLKARAPGGVAA